MLLSCLCLTAFAAGGGPNRVDNSVTVKAGDTYTYGEVTATIEKDDGTSVTFAKGEKKATVTTKCENVENGTMQGLFTVTQITVEGDSSALNEIMPETWSDKKVITLNKDGSFSPDLDLNKAAVEYTAESVKNDKSKTGYTTTFSVSDPDHSYTNVWAYGKWIASWAITENGTVGTSKSDYNTKDSYEPEAWENGMYYSDYGYRKMAYNDTTKCWELSLDLASFNMPVQCYKNIVESDLSGASASKTVVIPYDSEKQSKSFDWTITAQCDKAGTLTDETVTIADLSGKDVEYKLRVYTPYGYDANDTTTSYPVLYLIAGMQASYDSWFTGGLANVIFDNLIANGTIEPTIIVAMERNLARMDAYDVWDTADDRSKSNGDGNGFINYTNNEQGSGTENMIESPIVSTVIPFIDGKYNTVSDSEHRALVGVSMGGVAASQTWMTSPDTFNYYGFFSGSDLWFKVDGDEKVADEYVALKNGGTFTEDYTALLTAAAEASKDAKIIVGGGITDRNAFGGDQNSSGSNNIDAALTALGVEHSYSIVGGDHDWVTWTQLLSQFTEFLSADDSTWKVVKETDAYEFPFTDVAETRWSRESIEYVNKNGLFKGISDTQFSPDADMTREQVLTVMARISGETPATMADACKWAVENNISDGSNLKGSITREQLVTLLWRVAGSPSSDKSLSDYNDASSVASYAVTAMRWAVEKGIINGTGASTLAPTGIATREQVAAIVARYSK
jgi:enterochelin esterase-like enzyme